MLLKTSLSGLEREFHAQYEISKTIKHRGERGRQREDGLLQFLRDTLPLAYGVASGEILAFKQGLASPQCDIIIYDQLRMPILGKRNAVQQVPLEGVYAVIECKSVLDTNALRDFELKVEKIRALPRCSPRGRLKRGEVRGPKFILFGYKMATTSKKCIRCMKELDRTE